MPGDSAIEELNLRLGGPRKVKVAAPESGFPATGAGSRLRPRPEPTSLLAPRRDQEKIRRRGKRNAIRRES